MRHMVKGKKGRGGERVRAAERGMFWLVTLLAGVSALIATAYFFFL